MTTTVLASLLSLAALQPRPSVLRPTQRALTIVASTTTLDDTKEKLAQLLSYNKPYADEAAALVKVLASLSPPTEQQARRDGRYMLRSSGEFARTLRRATPRFDTPLLDGAPVVIIVEGEALTIETEMLVLGCATGLRLSGSVVTDGAGLAASLTAGDFFEPSEEFGIVTATDQTTA